MDDKKQLQDPVDKAVPHDLSDHDERGERLATEKHWDEERPTDAAAVAARRLEEFHDSGQVIYNEDETDDFQDTEEVPEHLNEELEESLEELAEKEEVNPVSEEEL